MHDTLVVDDEILVSFENIDFDYAVVANDAGSLEEALTIAGEQDSGDAIMPVIMNGQTWLYQYSNQQCLDENNFVLALQDLTGGAHILADRQDYISQKTPAPVGPFTDVVVDGNVSGTDNHADSFVFGDDSAWYNGEITNFELGVDRIDVSGLSGSDGQPLDFNDISIHPSGGSSELRINDDSDGLYSPVFLAGVPKYDPSAPIGELTYALGPDDFLFV